MKSLLTVLFASLMLAAAPAAVRAADAPTKTAATATDVSGTWDAVVETAQGSGTPSFTFKQDGEKLTGMYKGQFGEAPLTGSIKGNRITFTFQGDDLKMEYTGTVDGTAMKGTAKFGDAAEGTFTAKKRAH